MSVDISITRRGFLKVIASATGALIVGIPLVDAADAPAMPIPPGLIGNGYQGLTAFVQIDTDGGVLIGARDPETGTGSSTAEARIIAEELDADWKRVTVIHLGLGVEDNNGAPRWTYGRQLGGTGSAMPAAWSDLRQAGALARWLLLQAAARRLGVPADSIKTQAGVLVAPDGRRLGYGELATDAAKIDPPATPPALKSPDRYQLIGQGVGDVDALGLVTGQTSFAIDSYLGDTLVALVSHCPWPDGTLEGLDASAAKAVPGVVSVVQLNPDPKLNLGSTPISPSVAVLAESTWAALQGRKQLKLRWKPGSGQADNSAVLEQQAHALLDGDDAPTARVRDDGNFESSRRRAARQLEAVYHQPWQAHATPEPMNCLVKLDEDRITLVVPTQAPQSAYAVVQQLTGFKPEQIDIQVPRVGGGYGRRLDHDFVAEVVMLAKTTKGKPVKLMWTRDEDLAHDYYRPASLHKLQAVIDRKRQVIGWNQRMASASALWRRGVPDQQLWTSELSANQLPAGLVENYRSDWYGQSFSLPRGPMRGMPDVSNAFAVESFIDEIAHALKEDPLQTRLRLLGEARQVPLQGGGTLDVGRLLNVLTLVTERIEWKNWLRSVNGLGLACWHVNGTYVAHAIEVSLQGEQLGIERVVCAVDVGRVINPTGLAGQVAGATLAALSNALNPAINVRDGQVQQHSFKDYPLATMAQLPNTVEVISVPSDQPPAGASVLAMPTVAPALANAVFRVSAVRVRRLPLMRELLRLL
jgi:isoquinoline 1-oxidoreductase beta subunit